MIVLTCEGRARKYSIGRVTAMLPEMWQRKAKVKPGTPLYYHEDPEDPGKLIVATRDLTRDKPVK